MRLSWEPRGFPFQGFFMMGIPLHRKGVSLADPGGAHLVHTPLRDPILSFRHTNFTKHSYLGSPCPPHEVHIPLREILDPPLGMASHLNDDDEDEKDDSVLLSPALKYFLNP